MHMPTLSTAVTLATLVLTLASCAHGPSVEGPATSGQETEGQPLPPLPENIEGPEMPWAAMSDDQKAEYMTAHVVPTMAPLFQAFDEERYASFECGTCHGPRERMNRFEMPNPGLPVLPVPESPEWHAMVRERNHVFRFMAERVEPAMAGLLGVQPYDPQTEQGFGCFNCHTMEQ